MEERNARDAEADLVIDITSKPSCTLTSLVAIQAGVHVILPVTFLRK